MQQKTVQAQLIIIAIDILNILKHNKTHQIISNRSFKFSKILKLIDNFTQKSRNRSCIMSNKNKILFLTSTKRYRVMAHVSVANVVKINAFPSFRASRQCSITNHVRISALYPVVRAFSYCPSTPIAGICSCPSPRRLCYFTRTSFYCKCTCRSAFFTIIVYQ